MSVSLKRIHHVAYRCHDAKETVEFYQRVLNMDFQFAIAENEVPIHQRHPTPTCTCSSDAGTGNVLAFFEAAQLPEDGSEMNQTPNLGSAHRL